MKKYKHTKDKKMTERASFYVAMSVCLMAVGMAVWSAYSMLSESPDISRDSEYSSSLSSPNVAAAQDMTGVTELAAEPDTQSEQEQTSPETEAASEAAETRHQEQPRGFSLSETMPAASDSAEASKEINKAQAVLRVKDSLVYPVKSRKVIKEYSENSVYSNTMKDYRAHTGCDFEAEEGENVYAMSSGIVNDISVSELYGVIIEVDCGDYTVYYCGLSSDFVVDKGDEVSAGDTIGTVWKIPSEIEDGSHVHIEILSGGKLIDPLSVIESEN